MDTTTAPPEQTAVRAGREGATAPAAPDRRPLARDPAPARTSSGTYRHLGYAGLVPTMPAAAASVSDTDRSGPAATPMPILPGPTRLEVPRPMPAPSPETLDEPVVAPLHPNTGLPMFPTGAVTPTPTWKRRSRRTRASTRLMWVGVIVLMVAILWAATTMFSGPDGSSEATTTTTLVAGAATASGATTANRPEVATLLEELELDELGQPIPLTNENNYGFTLVDPFGFEISARVERATGDFVATTKQLSEIRGIDGRFYGRERDGAWIELTAEAGAAIPPALLAGPLELSDVLPPALADFVVDSRSDATGRRVYLIDDSRLAADAPATRMRWFARWGLVADGAVPDPIERVDDGVPVVAAPGDVLLAVQVDGDDFVSQVEIASPSIGGTASYRLLEPLAGGITIDRPDVVAGG